MIQSVPYRVFVIFIIWFAGLGAAAQFAKIAVPFEAMQAVYPNIGSGIGWLLTIISVLGAIFGTVAGTMVGRMNASRLLIGALILGGSLSFLQSYFPSFGWMLLLRFIEGFSHLLIVVAAPSLIVKFSGLDLKNWPMTLWSSFFGVTFVSTAWIGLPFVVEFGLSKLFLAHSIYMLSMAGILAFLLRSEIQKLTSEALDVRSLGLLKSMRAAYRSPFISAPAWGWLAYCLTYVSLVALIPTLASKEEGYQLATYMPLVSIFASLFVAPILLRFIEAVALIIAGFALAGFALLVGLFGLALLPMALMIFVGLGFVQGATFASIPNLNRDQKSRALSYGALAQMGNVGNLLGTPILLFALTLGGVHVMIGFVIAIYGFGVLAHIYLASKRKNAPLRGA